MLALLVMCLLIQAGSGLFAACKLSRDVRRLVGDDGDGARPVGVAIHGEADRARADRLRAHRQRRSAGEPVIEVDARAPRA